MRRLLYLFAFVSVLASFASCSREIKGTKAVVGKMTDTTLVGKIGDYSVTFISKDAKYDNGAVMPGDSVTIRYVGDLRKKEAQAVIITLIPRQGNVMDAVYDPDKELKTAPMTEEESKKLREGVEYGRKHGK